MERGKRGTSRLACAALALALAAWCAAGCRAPEDVAQSTDPPVLTLHRPLTIPALSLMPRDAALAFAVPCPEEFASSLVAIQRKTVADPSGIDAWTSAVAEGAAGLLGVTPPATLADAIRARGIDPRAPAALFVRFSDPSVTAKEIAAAITAVEGDEADAASRDGLTRLSKALSSLEWVVVTKCLDPELAASTLAEMLSGPGAAAIPIEPREAHGVTIQYRAPRLPCFFTVGTRLVVGNALDLVEGVAARLGDPAPIAYGSAACPCLNPEESVLLIPMVDPDRMVEAIFATAGKAGSGEQGSVLAPLLRPMLEGYAGPAPVVITVDASATSLDIVIRAEHETHPGLRTVRGVPVRMKHPDQLPATTLGSLTVEMNEPVRERVTAIWLAAMPSEMAESPEYGQVAGMTRRIVNQFDGELTLALASRQGAAPAVLTMAELANEAETQEFLLTLGFPGAPSDVEGDVPIVRVSLAHWGMPDLHYAFDDGAFMMSSDLTELRSLIRLRKAGGNGGFIQALSPSPDLETPMYRMCVLRSGFFDAMTPLLSLLQASNGGTSGMPSALNSIRELRWSASDVHGWYASRLLVDLR